MTVNQLSLTWDDFDKHISSTFWQLWSDKDFTDVTLTTLDDKQIRVHKVILSSASDYFRKILLKNPQHNPTIFLKDTKHHDVEMIMRFVYLGQCEVEQDHLEDFLTAGQILGIKGLLEIANSWEAEALGFMDESDELNDQETIVEVEEPIAITYKATKSKQEESINVKTSNYEESQVKRSKYDMKIKSKDNMYCCEQCGFKSPKKDKLKQHIEIKHEGLRHPCDQCAHKATRKHCLELHIKYKHLGVKRNRFQCELCGSDFVKPTDLFIHKQVKHEGKKPFSCDECDYKTKSRRGMYTHIQSVHKGVFFNCNICSHKAKSPHGLVIHKSALHEGIRFECDQCSYSGSQKGSLKLHKKSQHREVKMKQFETMKLAVINEMIQKTGKP